MGKKIRFWMGAGVGALMQYLYDPRAGESRRALLREQIADRALEFRDALGRKTGVRTHRRPTLRMAPLRSASRMF